MTEIALKYGYPPTSRNVYSRYLNSKGWEKHKQPRKADNTKYTGKEFCDLLNKSDNKNNHIICHIGSRHVSCIVKDQSFKFWDIWNCTSDCVGVYWAKKEN